MNKAIILVALLGLTISCGQSDSKRNAPNDSLNVSNAENIDTTRIDTVHNSQNSVDWIGTYETTLPCADCPGIKTSLTLYENETFQLVSSYLEKSTTVTDTGTFMWHDNGSVVHLKGKDIAMKLKVGENKLFQLDQQGKEIRGANQESYIYTKIQH